MSFLENVKTPRDVKALSPKETEKLAEEIRAFLISSVSETGGHLASNLGAVELTLAMHRVFDCQPDHFVFDVGHQSYTHKILTGRLDRFADLRKPGGLSGFTSREESEYDAFGAGHGSTSLSAGLGLAEADKLQGKDNYTVCVVGDGAYTGGLIHEALNNIDKDLRLVIVLNENGMSISPNKGAFATFLSRVRISSGYLHFKSGAKTFFEKIPLIGRGLSKAFTFLRDGIKKIIYPLNYFEQLGLYYIGPIDGNNLSATERALRSAKNAKAPVLVHLRTKKGYGYAPAEESPEIFHNVSNTASGATFHSIFAEQLTDMAKNDDKIAVVTAAMGAGTGMNTFAERYPDRYFDVGIAEGHALTFAAGLAAGGMRAYTVIYSTFMQRAYDQILHDIALQKLPVHMMIDRAGLSPADGVTHHGVFDVAFLSSIPGVQIYTPVTFASLRETVAETQNADGPIAIRYPNGGEDSRVKRLFSPFDKGILIDFAPDSSLDKIIVTYGTTAGLALNAEKEAAECGAIVRTVLLEKLTPYADIAKKIAPLLSSAKKIVFVEEGIKSGGACALLLSELSAQSLLSCGTETDVLALLDFPTPASVCDLYEYVGLTGKNIAKHFI